MPIRMTGMDAALELHRRAAAHARDLSPVLERAAVEGQQLVDQAWASERSPSGRAWPARTSPRPARTGRLQRATRVTATETAIVIEAPVDYASHQFFGAPDADLPGRNPLPVERGGRDGYTVSMRGAAAEWIRRTHARLEAHLAGQTGDEVARGR